MSRWRGEVTQGKQRVASMVGAAGHYSRENPACLTYAASGSLAVCLNTDTDLL